MSQGPVIGIATQTQEAIEGKTPRVWIMGHRYIRALTPLGAVPWLIPLLHDEEPVLRSIYERLDGIFLTGGMDVDPASYGEARHERCGPTERRILQLRLGVRYPWPPEERAENDPKCQTMQSHTLH